MFDDMFAPLTFGMRIRQQEKKPIAVTYQSFRRYGCPHCGFISCVTLLEERQTVVGVCARCKETFVLLRGGLNEAQVALGCLVLKRQCHPRHGLHKTFPSGALPNHQGFLATVGPCFVCGTQANFSSTAEVDGILGTLVLEAAEGWSDARTATFPKLFPNAVVVRHPTKHWIPAIVAGACGEHFRNLQILEHLVRERRVLSPEIVATATDT